MLLILQYRGQNSLPPIDHLPDVLDHYLCSLPENAGKCSPYVPLERGLIATIKGGIALLKSLMYSHFVAEETADERAYICAHGGPDNTPCPHNTFYDRRRFVAWCDSLAKAMVGKRKSKYHEELGVCGVCDCPLRGKVFYADPIDLTEDQIAQMNQVKCWQPTANR